MREQNLLSGCPQGLVLGVFDITFWSIYLLGHHLQRSKMLCSRHLLTNEIIQSPYSPSTDRMYQKVKVTNTYRYFLMIFTSVNICTAPPVRLIPFLDLFIALQDCFLDACSMTSFVHPPPSDYVVGCSNSL